MKQTLMKSKYSFFCYSFYPYFEETKTNLNHMQCHGDFPKTETDSIYQSCFLEKKKKKKKKRNSLSDHLGFWFNCGFYMRPSTFFQIKVQFILCCKINQILLPRSSRGQNFVEDFCPPYTIPCSTRNTDQSGERCHVIKVVYNLFYSHHQNFKC